MFFLGSGLGKDESGIKDAIKVKLKHDTAGVSIVKSKLYKGLVQNEGRAHTTLKSEGEVTSLSVADKREVRDNREKW